MEIGNLTTRERSNEGKWFVAELYGSRQPFAVNILGSDSDRVQLYEREQFKRLQKDRKSENDVSDKLIDELLAGSEESVIVRMNGLRSVRLGKGDDFELLDEPLTMKGEALGDDEASYRRLITEIPAVKDFILKKSRERANFL